MTTKMASENQLLNKTVKTNTTHINVTTEDPNCLLNEFCESYEDYMVRLESEIVPLAGEWVLIVLYIVTFLVGFIGNILVCFAIWRNRSMRTITNMFIVNLSVADLVVIVLVLPFALCVDVTNTWYFGTAFCKIHIFLGTLTMDELFWSSLPGIPKKMKWPVKVVKWLPKPLVYCKCDDAYFNVSRDQLVPFSDDVNVIETFKNKGIAALKKKKETKFRFLCDIEWANEALKQPRASHFLLPESCHAACRVKQYTKRQSGVSDIDRSMRAHLSKLEEHLLVSQELIETRGKLIHMMSTSFRMKILLKKKPNASQNPKTTSLSISILTLSAIAVERWYAICHPLRFHSTISRTRIIIVGIWVISICVGIPELTLATVVPLSPHYNTVLFSSCYPALWSENYIIAWQICLMAGLYFLPLFLMGFAYSNIAIVLWKDSVPGAITRRSTRKPMLKRKPSDKRKSSDSDDQVDNRKSAAKMLIAVVIVFGLCYFPSHLYNILRYAGQITDIPHPYVFALIAHWLTFLNSCINPIIYNFMSDKFRKEFRAALCFHCGRNPGSNGQNERYKMTFSGKTYSVRYSANYNGSVVSNNTIVENIHMNTTTAKLV